MVTTRAKSRLDYFGQKGREMAEHVSSEQLRELAERYQLAADKLRQAADALDGGLGAGNGRQAVSATQARRQGATRYQQVKDLLQSNGPMTRREILKATNIPAGTLSTLLAARHLFRQDDSGKWDLAPEEGE
jgi:hypothetical protein